MAATLKSWSWTPNRESSPAGACGSCPSSTMTLKMGIERKMREAIPEVSEAVQVSSH